MSSLDAFNDMMGQFLNELVLTFPEEKSIQKFRRVSRCGGSPRPVRPSRAL
jgi:hypothetical protein